ncbi:hypothetical protein [Polyangium mundeleinium]|uniref:Uncharacterized protein n=1 Tax=Polyangium mundeleinium TaxID=2995306 RepID=A0ABT5ESN5_9BACT|nr:hypothetical protein [Polyangium mundeleinium]MDC0744825.1 hypothetical protein [Polyangium mundeleinium]
MIGFRLPVSELRVTLRQLGGAEDMLLAEASGCDVELALALASALARSAQGEAIAWEALPLTDLDATLLRIRQMVIGDHVHTDIQCPAEGCGERIDIAFRVTDYLTHHQPRKPRGIERDREPGWFRMTNPDVSFRPPSGADQLAIADEPEGVRLLAERCIRPADAPARVRRRVEAAMEALAPSLYGELDGTCPACAATVRIPFDPQRYVLLELRAQAASLYEEVHLLAGHYKWSEQDILALPRLRRTRYAELIHAERSAG